MLKRTRATLAEMGKKPVLQIGRATLPIGLLAWLKFSNELCVARASDFYVSCLFAYGIHSRLEGGYVKQWLGWDNEI